MMNQNPIYQFTISSFFKRGAARRTCFVLAAVAACCFAIGGMSTECFAQGKGKGGKGKSMPKTSGGSKSVPFKGPRQHGHVGAQGTKYRPSSSFGSNSHRNHGHNHGARTGYSNHQRRYGNVYGGNYGNNRYGGVYNRYGNGVYNRYGGRIGFSTNYYSPSYNTYGYGVPNYRSTYQYGGLNTSYYQPNFTQPFGVSPSDYQPVYPSTNPVYLNNQNSSQIELLRLQLELQRLRQQEAELNRQQQTLDQQLDPPIDPAADPNQLPDPNVVGSSVINQLNAAPVIDAGPTANTTQHRAEKAFREGRYGQAAQFADLASSLNESNGLLKLFASQAHFANGNFNDASKALESATQTIDADQWSYIVDNFRLFYGKNDYVNQTQALTTYLNERPEDTNALLLRGFQFGALGYPDAASKDFDRALSIDPTREFGKRLKQRFGETEIEKPGQ